MKPKLTDIEMALENKIEDKVSKSDKAQRIMPKTELTSAEVTEQNIVLNALKHNAGLLGIEVLDIDTASDITKKIDDYQSKQKIQEEIIFKNQSTMTTGQKEKILRDAIRLESLRLVRIVFTVMNPSKRLFTSEEITIKSKYLGDVTKLIPFNAQGKPYHVPYCIYLAMKNKKYLHVPTTQDNIRKEEFPSGTLLPEYSIQVLPKITQEELDKLIIKQKAFND